MIVLRSILVLSVLATPLAAFADTEADPGPFLTRDGSRLMLHGKEFRSIGLNKWDLFHQMVLKRGGHWSADRDSQGRQALKEMGDHDFRVIRVACSGFWSAWWQDGYCDADPAVEARKRAEYFAEFDAMLDACDENNIIVVASLCFNPVLLADLGHHSLGEGIVNPQSSGRRTVDDYIRAVVSRYKDRPTIAMWEIGNEWNLHADMQNSEGTIPITPAILTPPPVVRDQSNNYTSDELAKCMAEMATLIKSIDANHLVTSGNSSPRVPAMHLLRAARKGVWEMLQPDSEAEIEEYIRLTHPDPIDVISLHYYEDAMLALGQPIGNVSNLAMYQRICERIGKPLLIGEIATHAGLMHDNTLPASLELMQRAVDQVIVSRIPLTLFWNYFDGSQRPGGHSKNYYLRYGETDAALQLLEQGNRTLLTP